MLARFLAVLLLVATVQADDDQVEWNGEKITLTAWNKQCSDKLHALAKGAEEGCKF